MDEAEAMARGMGVEGRPEVLDEAASILEQLKHPSPEIRGGHPTRP